MFCETLKRKFSLLAHNNIYLRIAAIDMEDSPDKVIEKKSKAETTFFHAFGTGLGSVKNPSKKKSSPQGSTIKDIVDAALRLRNTMIEGTKNFKYPELQQFPALVLEDFKNEPGTDEDIYKFGIKLGYCIMDKDKVTHNDFFVTDDEGNFIPDRVAVLKAIDEEFWTDSIQSTVHLTNHQETEPLFDYYKGVYAVYYPSIIDDSKRRFIKSTLRISHLANVNKDITVTRAKLNMPNAKLGDQHYYQYRGRFYPIFDKEFMQFSFDLDVSSINGETNHSEKVKPDTVNIICRRMNNLQPFSGVLTSLNQRQDYPLRSPYASSALIIRQDYSDLPIGAY
jgi:hypothetical protein